MSAAGDKPAARGGIEPGARFGDLTLVRELGRGAQGIVYEGHQESVGRSVAVKIMLKEVAYTEEQVDRFRREAEAAGRLNHPNIVAVYGLEETEHHLLLMQEMVTGGDLRGRLEQQDGGGASRTNVATCRWSAAICRDIASALHHAHQHGVIHRDIKPDNVLLTEEGVPKLSDFGLARVEDKLGLSTTGAIMGTPHYMSPEQVTAKPTDIDARTDVYALGSLLYRMLTGRVPFEAKTLQGIFNDILTRAPKPPRKLEPGVSPDLEAVCLRALEKAPADRYQSARDLAEDLERYLRGETTLARPVSFIGRASRALRRQSTVALAALALLVPTAWLAADALLLLPLAREDAGRHLLRMGVIGLATLLAGWPLGLLGLRLTRGGRAGAVAGWAVVLAAGGLLSWRVHEQRLDQLHLEARTTLEAIVLEEPVGMRVDVQDLRAYEAGWGGRFDAEDAVLMARGYVKRLRPTQAESWAQRLEQQGRAGGPLHEALLLAIHEGRGDTAAAVEAAARLWAHRGRDGVAWREWKQAGDILRDMGRHAEAREAYLQAGRLPSADRDAMNLVLAQVSADLCRWEAASDHLDDFSKWHPEDSAGIFVGYRLAQALGDVRGAEELLLRYWQSPQALLSAKVLQRYEFLRTQGREDDARALLDEVTGLHGDDLHIGAWLAFQYRDLAVADARASRGAARAGDEVTAARLRERAAAGFEQAHALFTRLGELPDGGLVSEVGLSGTAIELSDFEPERAQEHLHSAQELARAAIALDPTAWQGHYNLGHAGFKLAMARAGSLAAVPVDELRAYVAAMERVLETNGQHLQTLNNLAYVLGQLVFPRSGDKADIERALAAARLAVRASDPKASGGSCTPKESERSLQSETLDTLRLLLERAGDLPGALTTARAAREALAPDDAKWSLRDQEVERLAALVSDG